jgi:hypothetical protein
MEVHPAIPRGIAGLSVPQMEPRIKRMEEWQERFMADGLDSVGRPLYTRATGVASAWWVADI